MKSAWTTFAFSFDESALFLRSTMGLDLDGDSVRALGDRTEGWIAGLQMAALSRQQPIRVNRPDDMDPRTTPFSGEHRYVIDYLAGEVLRRQSDDVRSFLTTTGVLDRLSAPLCDAVTGRSDSKAMLPRLEQANMFLLPLDDSRQWYRYHQLFADFLRSRLEPGRASRVLQKASAWHETSGSGAEAIKYALAAAGRSGRRSALSARSSKMRSDAETCPRCSRGSTPLPDNTLREHSDLVGYKSWLLYLRGLTYEAQEYPAPPDPADASVEMPLSQRGMLYAFHSYLALNWGEPKDAIEPAKRALEQLGGSGSFFRCSRSRSSGRRRALRRANRGDRDAERSGRARPQPRQPPDDARHARAPDAAHDRPRRSARGDRALQGGRVQVRRFGRRAAARLGVRSRLARRPLLRDQRPGSGAPVSRNGNRTVSAARNDLPDDDGAAGARQVQFATGDREAAWNTLAEAREIAERPESPRRKRLVAVLTAELQLREGNVGEAARTLAAAHELKGSTTEHETLAFARLLIAQHHPSLADARLAKLDDAAVADRCDGSLAAIRVLQALCKRAQGHHSAALRHLESAVSLAASRGYRRMFLDEGVGLSTMLAQARHVAPEFVSGLLDALPREAETMAPALAEPLSKSEREILRLLNVGATNQEIADKLGTTIGTTKWHLNQIFGKLQVRNRTGAIAKARQLKLL
jgi:LuxR family maltose regulon positive regulatory protein